MAGSKVAMGSKGSRLCENTGAKKALRILFPSLQEQKGRPPQKFFALFDVFAPNHVFKLLAVGPLVAFKSNEENDSTDFSSVHVFTQPGS
jgi:hypothetical protein